LPTACFRSAVGSATDS